MKIFFDSLLRLGISTDVAAEILSRATFGRRQARIYADLDASDWQAVGGFRRLEAQGKLAA